MLTVRDLVFGFPGRRIGNVETLDLEPGATVALLGPNGGGKTTLIRTLLGLLPPLSGAVRIDGAEMSGLDVAARARSVGYVPQGHAAVFAFSVREVVMMGRTAHQGLWARPSAADRAAVADALASLDLTALAETPYTMISGGERQMAMIARALAQSPRFVMLDEPTASLDFGNQGKVLRRMRRLAESGIGVLFSTHDPNQALRWADRVVLFGDGGVKAQGAPDQVIGVAGLERLYAAKVEAFHGRAGPAYLPG